MTDQIVVSVAMITYNHEAFIEEALLSIFAQITTFRYEIVISDDHSNDATCEKIETLITLNKNPNCSVRFFKQDPNLGMMANFKFVLTECSGKFIALCEGDDYWTASNKLQQQYEVLESHPETSLCFHNAMKQYESSGKKEPFAHCSKKEFVSNDLFTSWLIPTASAFFRNIFKNGVTYPDYLAEGTHGDLALFALLGEYGNFRYIDKTMSVYRINEGGVTQSAFRGIEHNMSHILQLLRMAENIKNIEPRFFVQRINAYLISNAYHYQTIGDKLQMRHVVSQLTPPLTAEQKKELFKLKLRALWKKA
jgi:glycosyltransferase involved in cell wall biosynthesis